MQNGETDGSERRAAGWRNCQQLSAAVGARPSHRLTKALHLPPKKPNHHFNRLRWFGNKLNKTCDPAWKLMNGPTPDLSVVPLAACSLEANHTASDGSAVGSRTFYIRLAVRSLRMGSETG